MNYLLSLLAPMGTRLSDLFSQLLLLTFLLPWDTLLQTGISPTS